MSQREVFDVTKEPAKDHDRYGKHEFGQHCLLARRLAGARTCRVVQVNHSNYDTHYENFDFHIEQLGEFDRPFATLVADLADRGLLESTLICVMSEFGRTPKINPATAAITGARPGACCWRCGRSSAAASSARPTTTAPRLPTAKSITAICSTRCWPPSASTRNPSSTSAAASIPIADPAKGPIKELLA